MKHVSIVVRAMWDDEARVWVATSNDIDGLAVEADTMETLQQKVLDAIADLIELNGLESDDREIPVHIMAEHLAKVPNPCF
ncbi:DUF1902 domain-containing protein [Martelella mediterranea]|uniref:DUF1902 domain-containing protein n=1 Tax=Martelella mediterranea TaxID=293089 RepID=UPI001E3FA513|nr:DUF1902 domain-containing protein [Martelella mediterranea]MCD1636849.1 DUF1902 domain-containing protein [Martelella mediterranea]